MLCKRDFPPCRKINIPDGIHQRDKSLFLLHNVSELQQEQGLAYKVFKQ